jgi:glyoxylase-like metal-dependent hydrolase (beta-lactamase superfamily II)
MSNKVFQIKVMDAYRHERLSSSVWSVVEDDPFGQFPFLYIIMGKDKCIVIDTGTGFAKT